jgi:hypothetical protein
VLESVTFILAPCKADELYLLDWTDADQSRKQFLSFTFRKNSLAFEIRPDPRIREAAVAIWALAPRSLSMVHGKVKGDAGRLAFISVSYDFRTRYYFRTI